MNYIQNIDYRDNDFYKKQYNGLIEHFDSGIHEGYNFKIVEGFQSNTGMCSSTPTPSQEQVTNAANTFWLENSGGVYSGGDANYTKTMADGQQISLLAHVTGMTDEAFNLAFCILETASRNGNNYSPNVSSSIFGNSSSVSNITNTSSATEKGLYALQKYRDIQRTTPTNNFKLEADVISDVVNRLIEDQDLVWQAQNSGDSDFSDKLKQFQLEQAALQKGNEFSSPFKENVNQYKSNTNFYDNNLRLQARNKFITQFQEYSLNKTSGKEKMLSADIETKERYIQINRYEYMYKKDRVFYCKMIIVILGLAAICYGVGLSMNEEKKKIFNIFTIAIYVLGVIVLWLKISRDSVRYNLDWDEINFASDDFHKGSKTDNCVTRAFDKVGQSIDNAGQSTWNAAQTTGQAIVT